MALVAWLVFTLTFLGGGIYVIQHAVHVFATTSSHDTQAEFDTGTYSNTQWDGANSWVELSPTGQTNGSGQYTSVVMDSGGDTSWDNIAWVTERPIGNELPNNAQSETAYNSGNANMTGNVLLMHLNDASGSTSFVDNSGSNNNGSCSGITCPTSTTGGKLNGAYDFSSDYISVPDSPSLNFTNNMTLSAWVTADSFPSYASIIMKAYGTSWSSGYGIYSLNGNLCAFLNNPSFKACSSFNTTSSYRHVVATFDKPNLRLYFDGLEVANFTLNQPIGVSTQELTIGRGSAGAYYWDGKIDEVAVFNRTLSAQEIQDAYKRGMSKLKYQVRSCDDGACSGETFIGPSGTALDYYDWGSVNSIVTPSFALTNILNNRFFQYKAFFETSNASYTPELKSVFTDYTNLNQPPNIPTNSSPTNSAIGQDLNITLAGSAYSDTESNPQTNVEWRVDDDADFATPVWTRTAGSAEVSTVVNSTNGTFANESSWKTDLDHNTTYYWQVRYSDGAWSEWSVAATFTTNLIGVPNNSSPTSEATLTTLTPLLEASAFSDDEPGHTHMASQWLVDDNSDFSSVIYDSGETVSAETSRAIPGGILTNYATYYWKVRYMDSSGFWSAYSTSTRFSIQISETAVEVRPIFGNTTVDQGDSVNIDAQVVNFTDGSPLNSATSTINIYNPSGVKIVDAATMTHVAGSNGIYRYPYIVPENSGSYLYELIAIQGSKSGYGASNFEVRTIARDIGSARSTVESEQTVQTLERAAQEISRTEVSVIKKDVESGILDTPKTVKTGNTITIKYKADSGLSSAGAPKLNIYDVANVQLVTDVAMTEIGSTGVYSTTTTLLAGWGTGFFTVIVSENTNNTSDHTQIFVGTSDIESIGSDIQSIKSTVESTGANIDVLVGAFIITQGTVNDTSASSTVFVSSLNNTTDDFYKNAVLTFTSGSLDGQSRRISGYDGTNKTITLDPQLTSTPANGDAFTVVMQNVRVEEQLEKHEANQAAFRSDVTSRLSTLQTSVDSIYTLLQTVDSNLDSVQSTVNYLRTSQQKEYKVKLSDILEIQAGNTYRAKLTILDFESNPIDASTTPTILIYDSTRAVAQATTVMTKLSTGVYEYTSSISPSATAGLWESIVNVDIGGTADIVRNDYFQVTGAPAQVVINSVSDLTVPSTAVNVTITNEGGGAYEYQYEWCVVSSSENQCGGDDDVYYASAAKLILAGDSFNPTLTATVPNIGNYWFKVVVYYGTESSGASRTFAAITEDQTVVLPSGGDTSAPKSSLSTTENIYSEIIKTRNQLDLNSQKLARTLEILGIVSPGMQNLLLVNTLNTENLKDIQNKVADLKAVSSATRRFVEQGTVEPIVETYMKFNSVEIHFLITNPATEQQTIKFKAFLPAEAKPEHVLDLSGLKIDYDANAGVYYVFGEISLMPKETVTRKVEMKDVWVFTSEEIMSIKKQAESLMSVLKKTQYEAQGTILKNDIDSTLNIVLLRQEDSYSSPQDHIVVYRENIGQMARVQNDLEKLKDMVVQAGASRGLVGQVGGIQTFATWGIVLVIVFGFGLLAAVIFSMWRHQTMLAAVTMGMSRKELAMNFGKKETARHLGKVSKSKTRISMGQALVTRRSLLKKNLIWLIVTSVITVFGILAIRFAPRLFSQKDIPSEKQAELLMVPLVSKGEEEQSLYKAEKSIGSQLVSPEKAKMFFGTEATIHKLKILNTPTSWLNVRDTASLDSKVITKVYPDEEYEYTDEQGDWFQIILKDATAGWVYKKYVQTI